MVVFMCYRLQDAGYREYRDSVTGYLLPVAGEYKIQDPATGNRYLVPCNLYPATTSFNHLESG
ncbi:MAG TPA: hypothetical protein VGE79_04555 [Niastella sp.]